MSSSAGDAHERIQLALVGVPEPPASSWGRSTPESRGWAVGQFPGWAEPEFHDSEHGHGLANQPQNLGVRNQCPDLAGPTDTSCGQRTGNPGVGTNQ